jgi:hypothetical protein
MLHNLNLCTCRWESQRSGRIWPYLTGRQRGRRWDGKRLARVGCYRLPPPCATPQPRPALMRWEWSALAEIRCGVLRQAAATTMVRWGEGGGGWWFGVVEGGRRGGLGFAAPYICEWVLGLRLDIHNFGSILSMAVYSRWRSLKPSRKFVTDWQISSSAPASPRVSHIPSPSMFLGKKTHLQEYPISLAHLLATGKQAGIVRKNVRTLSRAHRSSPRILCGQSKGGRAGKE